MKKDIDRIREAFGVEGVTFQWLTRRFEHFQVDAERDGVERRIHPLSASTLFVVDDRWYKMIRGG